VSDVFINKNACVVLVLDEVNGKGGHLGDYDAADGIGHGGVGGREGEVHAVRGYGGWDSVVLD